MGLSSYRWTPRIGEHLLPGTKAHGEPRKQVIMTQPVAAYSLYTTPDDYARFVIAWLRDPALQQMTADAPVGVDAGLNLAWGLGWGLETSTDSTRFWQWGNNPGYRAFVLAMPATGDGLVLLTNSDAGLKLVEPLVKANLPGEHKVLRSPFLTAGVFAPLCEVLRVCL
jgi:CubicO group peptidase (beta-lactamase class C family)